MAVNSRSVEHVERACAAGGGLTELRLRVLDAVRESAGFDHYAFLLTDPQTTVGSAPLADVPSALVRGLPNLIRLKYLTVASRWTAIERVARLDREKSLVWQELLAGHDVIDVASLVFQDKYGCWGWLDLWRSGSREPFSPAELAFLGDVTEPITAALRRGQAETFNASPSRPPRPGPVVLLLSRELAILGQTAETDQYLRDLIPPAEGRPPIPAGAYNVGAQLLANEAGSDSHPPWARVHLAGGLWMTLRAAALGDSIAVSIEESSPAERVDLFARACGFTAREGELLGHLVKGGDTKEVARLMYLSEHTVQDHLKSMFAKSATHNRKTLLAHALGT